MAKMYTEYVSTLREDRHQQQRTCAIMCLLCTLLFVTIVMLCITLGIRYSGSRNALNYPSTVGDTRLISYSAPLCTGGQMNIGVSPSGYVGNMYFLDAEPTLSAWNILVLGGTLVFDSSAAVYDFYEYEYSTIYYAAWQFHLHPGSVINARSCFNNGGGANFIVIQGNSNFQSWLRRLANSFYAYEAQIAPCRSGLNPFYSFSISEEAYYYVVYYVTSGFPEINLALSINRTEYGTTQQPSCTLGSDGTCTAESQSSTKYVLFQTGRDNNRTITTVESFNLMWRCDSNDGVYAAIFFVPLIILALLFCGCFGVYCIVGHYHHRH